MNKNESNMESIKPVDLTIGESLKSYLLFREYLVQKILSSFAIPRDCIEKAEENLINKKLINN